MTALTYDERQDLVTAVYRSECAADGPRSVDFQRTHLEMLFGLPDDTLRQRAARMSADAKQEHARKCALRLR
jgi:hypothetical protein